jgi:hypothetical protein
VKETKADVILNSMTCRNRELELQSSEKWLIRMKSQSFQKVDQDLHKCFDRFVVMQYSIRLRRNHWLWLQNSELSVEWYKKNLRTLKSRSEFSRIVTEFEALKSRSCSIKFVLRSSYRFLICAFTDQCWYLYDDDTNQVSILMM